MTEKDNKESESMYPCSECDNPFPPHKQCLIITSLKQKISEQERRIAELTKELESQREVVRQAIMPDHTFCLIQREELEDKLRTNEFEDQNRIMELERQLKESKEENLEMLGNFEEYQLKMEQQVRELREKLNEKF